MTVGWRALVLGVGLGFAVASAARTDVPESRPSDVSPALPKAAPEGTKPAESRQEYAPSRGRLLYETHCLGCHESVVHVREKHRATSAAAVEGWVRHWSTETKLSWTEEEVAQVANYLIDRFYRFDRPSGKPKGE